MTDIFKIPQGEGKNEHWGYFSDSKGDIIDCGEDQAKAEEMALSDSPRTTIAQALANDSPPTIPGNTDMVTNNTVAANSRTIPDDSSPTESPSPSPLADIIPIESAKKEPEKPKKNPLSPAFIKKIVEQLGKNTTNLSLDFERFMFKVFGFTTEDFNEEDDDVMIIRMGWDALWQEILAGNDPPLWMILAFGYSCTTVRLVTTAKRIPKKEITNDS